MKDGITLVVDKDTRRPGCVLLQATYGGDSRIVSELFEPHTWHLAPTAGLCMVTGTREQWERHAEQINAQES